MTAISAPSDGTKATYSASVLNLAVAASATNIFTIEGSGTKTVRILKIVLSGIQTAAGNMTVILRKQLTADSSGTFSNPTMVPHDSSDAAATASLKAYTANPTTGALVGAVVSKRITFPGAASAYDPPTSFYEVDGSAKALVLRGTGQGVAVSFNGVSLTGGSVNLTVTWTEE